jgi:peptidoglycan L-alanyl-D-glutamate endopeptidase CwlK
MYKFSSRSLERMEGLDCRLVLIAHEAIKITKIDFGIPSSGGLRTAAQQKALYDEGASQLDGIKNKSYHQTGKALDFFAYVDNKASWETEPMALIACAFLQAASNLGYKLEWGGLWTSFTDYPHVQLID